MTSKTLFGKLALAGCTLIATIGIGRAQVGIGDIGLAIPTPPAIAVVQTNYQAAHANPGGLNYYFDNGSPPGSTFVTPTNNAGGYLLNSVAFKTMDDSSTSASFSTSQTYVLSIYSVSGTAATLVGTFTSQAFTFTEYDWLQFTNFSVPVSANGTYAYTIHRSSTGWENLGFTNGLVGTTSRACTIPLAGGTVAFSSDTTAAGTYEVGFGLPTSFVLGAPAASAANPINVGTAVTLTCGTIVDNVGNGTYQYQWMTDGGSGGALTNIPGATFNTNIFNTAGIAQTNLGNYKFVVKVTDSTSQSLTSSPPVTVDVFLRQVGTIGTTPASILPSPGATDAYQLGDEGNGNGTGSHPEGNLNYYSDNGQNSGGWMGDTFTTGSNPKGYTMGSLAVCFDGQTGVDGAGGIYGNASTIGTVTNGTYNLYIYKVSTDLSTAQTIMEITNWSPGFVISNYPVWAVSSFAPLTMLPNTVYGYGIGRGSVNCGYMQIALSQTANAYAGGTAASFPAAGGAITYQSAGLNGVFDVELDPLGFPFIVNAPKAAPSPAYALSPVQLTASVKTPGTYTYTWLTDDGSFSTPPNYIPMPGAVGANPTVVVQDVYPGCNGCDYQTNYYFVATRTLDNVSVTSSVVTLTVHSGSPPLLTSPTPASLVTFAGGTITYTPGETGTLLMTNQWQFDNGLGGGYVALTAGTNSTLILTNLSTANSGNYKLMVTNSLGNASTTPVKIFVLGSPAAPDPVSQAYCNMVYTNKSWAYWRLNELGNPATDTVQAYDYSGHSFFPTYGSAMTVNNAGPVPPSFPGFNAGEVAAGTVVSTANSYLTVPVLNLVGKSNVTFMAWINPNGTQAPDAGLFFSRGGSDVACGFGFGNTAGHLGYTWDNNSAATYNWDSGLVPANGQWNFVAYVITPTNTSVYMGNLAGGKTNFYQSVNSVANIAETFTNGTVLLGGDPSSVNRNYNGLICEAALFTNALTTLQVQQYFQAAVGATSLRPGVSGLTVAPGAATNTGVYSGQNVRMDAGNVSGTFPITNKWQTSPDGSTWADVAGATGTTLLINPQVTGVLHYQLVAGNIATTVTSSPVVVTFNALPSTPPGLWTINFQPTNNIGAGQNIGGGVGHYVGRGILGSGTYWNILPHVLPTGGGYNANTIISVSDVQDDAATHTGIYCYMNSGGSYNALNGGSLTYSSDIGNILDQFYRTYYSPNSLQFLGVPSGIYNLVCYAGNGQTINGAGNYGSTFVVHDLVHGDIAGSTSEASPTTDALSQGVNFVIFTNIYVTNGVLNVDVNANTNASASASAVVQAAQLQLVSYAVAPAPVRVTGQYVLTNNTLTVTWPQGIIQTAANLNGPWTPIYAPSPVTMTATNGTQFFRTQVHP